MHKLLVIATFIFISGCADQPQKLNTSSGNPEVSLGNVSKKTAIDAVVADKLSIGMSIRQMNDYGVTFAKTIDQSFMASLLYGSRYDINPEVRITYSFVESKTGLMIYSSANIITNPGSAYERSSEIPAKFKPMMQAELERYKNKLTSQK